MLAAGAGAAEGAGVRHDGPVHYVESGTGTPLVLLHAFPVDARMWDRARTQLEDSARVITPDQRGLGSSPLASSSPGNSPLGVDVDRPDPSMDVAAADVLALLDELGLRRAVLGGCSMGGYVAMAVLRKAPERVAGLLLTDTKAEADGTEQRDNRLAAADRAEHEGTAGWLAEGTVPNVLGATTREQRPEVVAEVREQIGSQRAEGVAWAQRAMADRPDSAEVLREFTGPALVVVGEEDALTPPESARTLASLLPNSAQRTIARAGHLAPVEDAESFAATVRPWLEELVAE